MQKQRKGTEECEGWSRIAERGREEMPCRDIRRQLESERDTRAVEKAAASANDSSLVAGLRLSKNVSVVSCISSNTLGALK